MPLRRTVRKLSSNLSIDTPILVAAKAGLDSTVAAASARSMRFMVQFPPIAALGDERSARCSHLEMVRLFGSRPKISGAHLACRVAGTLPSHVLDGRESLVSRCETKRFASDPLSL